MAAFLSSNGRSCCKKRLVQLQGAQGSPRHCAGLFICLCVKEFNMPHHLSRLLHGSRVTFLALLVAATASLTLAPQIAEAAVSVPVSARNFEGSLNITGFTTQVVNGLPQVAAIASVTGTL